MSLRPRRTAITLLHDWSSGSVDTVAEYAGGRTYVDPRGSLM